jgi:hypothetical protein
MPAYRLVNIEARCNIAPTDFCRVKLQGITGSIPVAPQTAHFVGDSKEAVSAGISPVSSPTFCLCGHQRSLEAIFGLRSLYPKIPFLAAVFRVDRGFRTGLGQRKAGEMVILT